MQPGKKSQNKFNERHLVAASNGGAVSVILAHPATYQLGMSSLGFQVVWRILNATPGVWVERGFAGESVGEKPRSIESNRHASDFDVVAFSLSYEPDALNMCRFLVDTGIPLESRKRRNDDPIVIAGGIVPTLNPEPYSNFIDLFVIGEAEESLPELMAKLIEFRGASRTRILAEASLIPGVYAPKLYDVEYGSGIEITSREPNRAETPQRVIRRWIKNIDKHPAHSVFFAPESKFGDMGLIELSRGCAQGCRFCAAGHVMRPPRHRSLGSIAKDVDFLKEHFDCLGLVASTVTDHPDLNKILDLLADANLAVSFASLPAVGLTERVLDAAASRSKTLTIAPETGTERLRKVVNKNISNEGVIEAAVTAAKKGINRIKMYFLIGLPTETGEDVAAIGELTKSVAEATRKVKKNIEIAASVAPFIPKADTPFGFSPMEDAKVLEARLSELNGIIRKITGAVMRKESVHEAMFQGLLSRGDRRVGQIIKNALSGGSIKRALRDAPKWALDTLYAKRTADQAMPWSFIESGIETKYLIEEYHQGLMGKLRKPCKPLICTSCGVCSRGK